MHAVCAGRDCHVHAVIDNKGHTRARAQGLHLLGGADHFLRRPTLLAELDDIGTARNGKRCKLHMGVTGLEEGIGNHMKSSNPLHSLHVSLFIISDMEAQKKLCKQIVPVAAYTPFDFVDFEPWDLFEISITRTPHPQVGTRWVPDTPDLDFRTTNFRYA